ncbi:hypothetical protein [Desulfovibrio sp.]|uniref:hypothetical protein n=1 Tax=Desulfovibrio sp. TaxID=885 RepID=UPI0025C72EFF|nr:hypothetical protein [Desulfovibrio sp.]
MPPVFFPAGLGLRCRLGVSALSGRGPSFSAAAGAVCFQGNATLRLLGNGAGGRPPQGAGSHATGARMSALQMLRGHILSVEMFQRPDFTRHHAKSHEPYPPHF